MTFDDIFEAYYNQYRSEASTPPNTDDEYVIGMRFANDAIRRWASYDNTMWQELFTTSVLNSAGGVITTTAGTATYNMPTAYKALGGFVRLLNADGTTNTRVPVVGPQDTQFLGDNSNFAWVSGNPSNGAVLRFNSAPTESGLTIEYDYYKQPDLIATGSDMPEMSDPDFVVDSMLANRFRASRNPYYGTAKRDAEGKLAQMKMTNDSGSWSNPWSVPDRSGSIWGESNNSNSWSF